MRTTLFSLLLSCFVLTGYSQDAGTVVFYRESARRGGVTKANINANGKEICRLGSNKASYVRLNPGDYLIQEGKDKKSRTTITVTKNDTVFVKVEAQLQGTYARFQLQQVEKRQGKLESGVLKQE